MDLNSLTDPNFWVAENPHLSITPNGYGEHFDLMSLDISACDSRWREHLTNEGYLHLDKRLSDDLITALQRGVVKIRADLGLPLFVFVYDEYWNLFRSLSPLIQPILGNNYKMCPDFWVWYVDPLANESGWGPHRDKSYDTLLDDGMPKSLTIWLPLTDADPRNGCMYLVPANQDPLYRTSGNANSVSDIQSIRALPAAAGSILMWNQRILHWGGRSSDRAASPRISMAYEFQRGDIPAYNRPLLDPNRLPSFNFRLKLIGKQILQYAHMYKYTDELVDIARRLLAIETVEPWESKPTPANIGRNDPCHCGSGKRFKHCHGQIA